MKNLIYILVLFLCSLSTYAQSNLTDLLNNSNATRHEIINAFNSEYPDIEIEYYRAMRKASENGADFFRSEKYAEFKPYIRFKRFENRVLNKLDDNDYLFEYNKSFQIYSDYNYEKLRQKRLLELKSASEIWKPLGPKGYVTQRWNATGGGGRIDRLRFHPYNSSTMYACSPAGGLWKTTDNGESWIPLTDFTGVTAVSDLLIHPENADTLYLATGESDTWWMNGSIGILKSVNGGQNWTKTGLALPINQHVRIQRLLMHPNYSDSIYAGTSIGLFLTVDAGDTWEQLNSINVWNMEFKPENPNVIYIGAVGGFYKSEDAGKSFQKVISGLPSLNIDKFDIAVSKSSPDKVYTICQGKNDANTFLGLYRSDNSGNEFSLVYNSKNLFSWDEDDLKQGVGGWEMAVSDVDANCIIVGGIHNWRSKDGGETWVCVGSHASVPENKWTHCDVHFLTFLPGDANSYFSCNDGGIYKTTDDGNNWEILIGEMGTYLTDKLGISSITANKFITGNQDNSTVIFDGDKFVMVGSGDGQHCFFDRTNDNYIYLTAQNGWTQMSDNGGYNWIDITIHNGKAAWAAPFMQDPVNPATIYQARQRIFRSDNRGSSWQTVGSLEAGNPILSMDICDSSPSVIWSVESNTSAIFRLEGAVKYDIYYNPGQTGITSIIAHPLNPMKAYISCTGFNPDSKVYTTDDGGKTWENLSAGLPNLPVNCIYYLRGSNDRIFVGLNVGLFYRDNESNGWIQIDEGLPHSEITDIEYFYPTNRLRVAVYGRGIWEYDNSLSVSSPYIKEDNEVVIFPNPVEDFLNLKTNNQIGALISVFDLNGKKIYEEIISEDLLRLNFTSINPGVYVIRLTTTDNKILSTKFIKK